MKLMFIISTAIFVYSVIYIIMTGIYKKSIRMEKRLGEIKESQEKQDRVSKQKVRTRLDFLHVSMKMRNDILLSGIKIRPEEYVLLWILLILAPAALCYAVAPNILRILGLIVLGAFLPPIYIKMAINKRQTMFEKQLGDTLILISNALRAGYSFTQSLDTISKDLPDPIGYEFRTISRELQIGGDIEATLAKTAIRMNNDDMKLLATSVVIQQQVGGNLAEILDTISSTIRDRLSIKRSIKTITAQGRISGKIIGFLPVGLLVILTLINPSYMQPLFTTTLGYAMIIISIVMEAIGFLVISKIVNLKF